MRNAFLCSLLLVSVAAPIRLLAADPVLWYQHPAEQWRGALPVGNGRLGGMVFGEITDEHIQLNEDTVCKRGQLYYRRDGSITNLARNDYGL